MLHATTRHNHIIESIKAKLIEPKTYAKYITDRHDKDRYDRYMRDWLLIDTAAILIIWLATVMNGNALSLLIFFAAGASLLAMPYTIRHLKFHNHH
jgi:hypothetical protein